MMTEAELANRHAREDLAACYRGMDYYGLGEGICNHLSLRAPARSGKGEVMLLVPYGIHWSQMTASSLIGIDMETQEVVEGKGNGEENAVSAHLSIYKAMKDVRCVMHIHPPYATALSCLKEPWLKMIHQTCMRFYGKVGYDLQFGGTVAMGNESTRLADKMAGRQILVMGNHGIMGIGKSAGEVFDNLYYFERAAMIQMLADATGKELAVASNEVAQGVAEYTDNYGDSFKIDHLEALKKVLERKEPNFRL
ncbi:adducin-related protein C1289.14-like [Acanthaster planci]|uniref:Adducin-related protein C1289.14-like n=1 Tax=Acanthaster planci TaxID=133434 RepID=A0A8B7XNC3_ACAPL|nr:adducin-related protein C1289.14-like [Acanthaster planci]XP_022082319.1 adducin-related protein C1289.14-like [Acanthaster planci]XP_022082320.1 adducin-related protein C1289.14-like [Acanthaster planci]XP_022082321.1 adducin-related protein C1289.14-like [Acanthaster planci]